MLWPVVSRVTEKYRPQTFLFSAKIRLMCVWCYPVYIILHTDVHDWDRPIRRLLSGRRVAAVVCVTRVERVHPGDGPPARRRSKRCGFCPPDLPDFDKLLQEADDQLSERTLNNSYHTLHQLLPPQSAASQKYNLRRRSHDRQLHAHPGHLSDCNFITRLLYKNSY